MNEETTGQLFREAIIEPAVAKLMSLDPKLVTAAVTFVLTYLLVGLLHLDLNGVIIALGTVKVTWAMAVAYVAAHAAGYWKANVTTFLRKAQPEGNPDLKLVKRKLGERA